MNIAYILNSAHLGGGNMSMMNLWQGLKGSDIKIFVACPSEGPMWDMIKSTDLYGILFKLKQPDLFRPISSLMNWLTWSIFFKKNKISLIHTNDLITGRIVCLAAWSNRIPLICHVRFSLEESLLQWVFRKLPSPAGFIFNSQELKNRFGTQIEENYPHSFQSVVYNGVDIDKFQVGYKKNKILRVGIIANLLKIKGHQDFLKMAEILNREGKKLSFDVIGDDLDGFGAMKELKSYANKQGIAERINFHGYVQNVSAILKEIDIIVCSSHYETFGRCNIEAMACGKPVVATNVGGIPEIVVDSETGILVPPHSPELLARAVSILIENEELRIKMGLKGRTRVEKYFSTEAHAKSIKKVYYQVIKTKTKGLARYRYS